MAKILIVSREGLGAWFSLRLLEEGNSVDVWIQKSYYQGVLSNIIPKVLTDKPNFSAYDLILFDVTGTPKLAEEALLASPTLGDGNLHCQLEDDRLFGIEVMENVGINVPFYEAFDDIGEAKRFIRKTNKRFVFKPSGDNQSTATTYVSKDAEDLLRYLEKVSASSKGSEFILQEVVNGTEISTEAYFNGTDFFLLNGTLEEKKFMNGRLGPNTGCSGNLVWMYNSIKPPAIFRHGLGKMKDFLQQYGFRGMIDLNTIVTESQIYGLEWTPRFGYDASATIFSRIESPLGDFLGNVATGNPGNATTGSPFAASVRISIPPYPSEIKGEHPESIPIEGVEEDECIKDCYLYDCTLDNNGELVSAGVSGFIMAPIAGGESIAQSFGRSYSKVDKIHIPDMQYRTDLEEMITARYNKLDRQGWLI